MRNRFRKLYRDFLVGRVITNGKQLQRLRASRAGVDASLWPEDCAHLDSIIDRMERQRRGLLLKLKEG